jgi:hypothetical protein
MTLHAAGPEALNEDRLVFFNGLVLQTTPLAISMQRGLPTVGEGVYVSCRYPGSPASVSGPAPTSRILEVFPSAFLPWPLHRNHVRSTSVTQIVSGLAHRAVVRCGDDQRR